MQQLTQWELDRMEDKAADQRWLDSKRQQGTVDIRYSGNKRDKKVRQRRCMVDDWQRAGEGRVSLLAVDF